jgi:hypothetical protein
MQRKISWIEGNEVIDMKDDLGFCEWGLVTSLCYDGYPPFKIWKAKHELILINENGSTDTINLCSDCLNFYYIDNEEKEENTDYDLSHIDKKALNKWNKEESDRIIKRAEYLERVLKTKVISNVSQNNKTTSPKLNNQSE